MKGCSRSKAAAGSIATLLGVVMLVIQGCARAATIMPANEPLAQAERMARAPLKDQTTVKVPGGTVTFFRFENGTCGSGYVFDINGASNVGNLSSGKCGVGVPLWFQADQAPGFKIVRGDIKGTAAERVRVTLQGATEPQRATVVNGFWYLFLPNTPDLLRVTKVEAVDRSGKLVGAAP